MPLFDIGTAGCLIPIEKEQMDSNENKAQVDHRLLEIFMNEDYLKKNEQEHSLSCPNMDCDQKGILFINNMKYAASLHCLPHCKGTSVKEKFLKNVRIRTCNENFKKTTILNDEKEK